MSARRCVDCRRDFTTRAQMLAMAAALSRKAGPWAGMTLFSWYLAARAQGRCLECFIHTTAPEDL